MAFNKPQYIDAPGGTFNHVLGNQYNIALHPPVPFVSDNNKVSVSVNLRYHDGCQPVSTHVCLMDANVSLRYWDNGFAVESLYQHFKSQLGIPAGYHLDVVIPPSEPKVQVTHDYSCYDAKSRSGLCISSTQTLAEYWKAYRSYHKLLERKRTSTSSIRRCDKNEPCVEMGFASLKFRRTLRIPDDAQEYLLPPNLGTFPLVPTNKYSQTIPQSIKARGGYLMPMFQREALWIEFYGRASRKTPCAIKVSVGGINAITGLPRDISPPDGIRQDYIANHKQPWLDGICVSPGVVRQFVAMPLGRGYTIEEQLTGQGNQGGIQFDVFPLLSASVRFRTEPRGKDLPLFYTPQYLGIPVGSLLVLSPSGLPPNSLDDYMSRISGQPALNIVAYDADCTFQLFVKNLHGKTISLMAQYQQTVRALKKQAIAYDGSLQYASWLYAGKKLEDDRTLSDYGIMPESCIHCVIRLAGGGPEPLMMDDNQLESELLMGIASGGTISQKVYKDSFSADEYDEEAVQRLWIHTVSSAAWETITGVVAPMSPIVPGTYENLYLQSTVPE